MDIEKLTLLEECMTRLLEAFAHLKEENQHLTASIGQLEQTVLVQQKGLERMQHVQEELRQLQTVMQVFRHEREFFREKLGEMLSTIEQLEGLSDVDKRLSR